MADNKMIDHVILPDQSGTGTEEYKIIASTVNGTGEFSLNRKADTDIGDYSFAEGFNTTASGNASHAEGYNTVIEYNPSNPGYNRGAHAEGVGTILRPGIEAAHVSGRYNYNNIGQTDGHNGWIYHIIGWGTSDTVRKNNLILGTTGNLSIRGNLYIGATNNGCTNGHELGVYSAGPSPMNSNEELASWRITNPMYICAQNCFNVTTQDVEFQISNDGIYAQGFKDGGNEIKLFGFNQISLGNAVIHNIFTPENPDGADAASVDYVDKQIEALRKELSK